MSSRHGVTGRQAVLSRIREALATAPGEPSPVPGQYRTSGLTPGSDGAIRLFEERVKDYGATVTVVADGSGIDIADAVSARLGAADPLAPVENSSIDVPPDLSIVVPPDLDLSWLPPGSTVIVDDALSTEQIDQAATVVTGCALAIAETGTIVLDASAGQGRRALSLIPDHHICVVFAHQVVSTVPEAVRSLVAHRPLTWISGPSATSDIELSRVEGVHGPRRLDVILVTRMHGGDTATTNT